MYEIIDDLCHITNELFEIIKKQSEIIAQLDVCNEIKEKLKLEKEKIEKDFDLIEYKIRHL